eukprot:NODE_3912_length_1963_cov_2.276688.p2 GENE.NODE_3912_length_1963_cov_2.276688~~NODE_3912_length_1963_cov_2.276688.p2  ORF type:complete len:276 (-),score=105.91 NODE_3912_length_1963_cov_2.276688:294-1121(-)
MKVVIADIEQEPLKAALTELQAAAKEAGRDPKHVLAKRCDVASAEDNAALAAEVFARRGFGEVGFLFLNAGISIGLGVLGTSAATLRRQLDVNVLSVWHGIQTFVPAMISQQRPCCVVATSSVAGLFNTGLGGIGSGAAYTMSKHAVTLAMEVLHAELRRKEGCQVSAHILCPGPVDTPYFARSASDDGFGKTRIRESDRVPVASIVARLEKGVLTHGDFYIKAEDPIYEVLLQTRIDGIKKGKEPFSEQFDESARRKIMEAREALVKERAAAKL